ncbi:hypothetical protein G7054_g14784 [Neopestalotiopsis clavispora]|nr:hypothetical protein G7054_g14784 [Neopestalotiopsis clavispora]
MLHHSTIRKQQIVANNPHEQRKKREQDFEAVHDRINALATSLSAREAAPANNVEQEEATIRSVDTLIMRNYRDKVQPEVKSVTRAMRRYEKKSSTIIDRIDIKLEYLDQRSNDAIALAAVAARQKNNQGSVISWIYEQTLICFCCCSMQQSLR